MSGVVIRSLQPEMELTIVHRMKTTSLIINSFTAALCLLQPAMAHAQDYPSKPIRVIAEFAAGGGGDIYLRVVTGQLSKIVGQPVVVDNRAGAGGLVASEAVIRSAPDGHTLLTAGPASLILRPFVVKVHPIDLARDLTPITGMWTSPALVTVTPNLPVQSINELIAYARANPGKLAYGTSGVGTHHHFNGEQIQQYTGIRLVHVPYKATNQTFIDLAAGQLPMAIGNSVTAKPFLASGKIRSLAVVAKRFPMFPDTPSLPELIPGFSAVPNWVGLFGPAKLPTPILRRLNAEVNKALATREVIDITREDAEIIGDTPEAFQADIRQNIAIVARIAKAANIQPGD
jgi:tripartite-type tricarboxylate transporter receptor subunit TctC